MKKRNLFLLTVVCILVVGTGCSINFGTDTKQTEESVVFPPVEMKEVKKVDNAIITEKIEEQSQDIPEQNSEMMSLKIHKSYDCEKTKVELVEVPKTTGVARASLDSLYVGKNKMTVYLKDIYVKDGTAYIDWVEKLKEEPNLTTSCNSGAFMNQIERTLTEFNTVDRIVHSIESSVKDFYEYMQLSCPDGYQDECYAEVPQVSI